jgi:hypothetical protein
MTIRMLALVFALFAAACASDGAPREPGPAHDTKDAAPAFQRSDAGARSASQGSQAPGLIKTATGWQLRTEAYAVNPGQERYVCYTAPVAEDMVISAISSPDNPMVHHFLLVEPQVPEQLGSWECDVILELTWSPLYAATHANSGLDMPRGTARTVKTGSQLLLQLHLSNTTDQLAYPSATVDIQKSNDANPTQVGLTLFGSTIIHLSPGEKTVVTSTCKTNQDLNLYAVLPHMHRTGTRLALEMATPDHGFETFYKRDPFSFDDQYFDPITHTIPAGSSVRIDCSYANDTTRRVDFGESAEDEMCFAIGFTIGGPSFQFCSAYAPAQDTNVPRQADAGSCTFAKSGIGQLCSMAGGECEQGLFCTADFFRVNAGICFSIGCNADSDCGAGNTCCTLPNLGTIANLCIPEACRPGYCMPTYMEGQ